MSVKNSRRGRSPRTKRINNFILSRYYASARGWEGGGGSTINFEINNIYDVRELNNIPRAHPNRCNNHVKYILSPSSRLNSRTSSDTCGLNNIIRTKYNTHTHTRTYYIHARCEYVCECVSPYYNKVHVVYCRLEFKFNLIFHPTAEDTLYINICARFTWHSLNNRTRTITRVRDDGSHPYIIFFLQDDFRTNYDLYYTRCLYRPMTTVTNIRIYINIYRYTRKFTYDNPTCDLSRKLM